MDRGKERACAKCGKAIPETRHKSARYCDMKCLKSHSLEKWRVKHGASLGLSTSTTGAVGELIVAVDLMKRGLDVFRALSPSSSCDLAFLFRGRLIRVDVRTGYVGGDGKPRFHKAKKDAGRSDIYACVVHAENAIYYLPDLETILEGIESTGQAGRK